MELTYAVPQLSDTARRRLDDDLLLLVLFDPISPAIDRPDPTLGAHARGQVFLDQRPSESDDIHIGREGRPNDYELAFRHHPSSGLTRCGLLFVMSPLIFPPCATDSI